MHPNDHMVALLDDIYIIITKARAVTAFQTVTEVVRDLAGIHTGPVLKSIKEILKTLTTLLGS